MLKCAVLRIKSEHKVSNNHGAATPCVNCLAMQKRENFSPADINAILKALNCANVKIQEHPCVCL